MIQLTPNLPSTILFPMGIFMQKISVICAFLPSRNTGMYTVDLSAVRFFTRNYPDSEVSYYCLGDVGKVGYAASERHVEYHPYHLHLEDVKNSDLIVYWGDFLHSKPYWEADLAGWLVRDGIASSKADATELIYKSFMLEDCDDKILRKAVLFGGTIISVGASELSDARYAKALTRLISLAGGVFFRDAISAAKADPWRGGRSALGIDCALLLERIDYEEAGLIDANAVPRADETRRLGVFFGRSRWIAQPLAFSRLLGRELKSRPTWLPWLRSAPRQLPLARLAGYPATREPPLPTEIIAKLLACEFVVTDTYHLCVNSWNLGIPAICIGSGSERVAHTLGDKKKEVLYSMYGANAFYVYREALANVTGLPQAARTTADILKQHDTIRLVKESIARHSASSRGKLKDACSGILEESR
jgi:hypothetical protein